MAPGDDHILLDRCATDLRASLALLKARILDSLHKLSCPQLSPREINDVARAFEDVTSDLLDESINRFRARVLSDDDHNALRKAYFREQSRRE